MKTLIKVSLIALCLSACASSPPATASSANEAADTQASKPDTTAAQTHLEKHVKYPASRSQILAACANTPEFTAGEKRWFEQNLPEGNYQSASEVIAALKL
jgi:hypothetical protein